MQGVKISDFRGVFPKNQDPLISAKKKGEGIRGRRQEGVPVERQPDAAQAKEKDGRRLPDSRGGEDRQQVSETQSDTRNAESMV